MDDWRRELVSEVGLRSDFGVVTVWGGVGRPVDIGEG